MSLTDIYDNPLFTMSTVTSDDPFPYYNGTAGSDTPLFHTTASSTGITITNSGTSYEELCLPYIKNNRHIIRNKGYITNAGTSTNTATFKFTDTDYIDSNRESLIRTFTTPYSSDEDSIYVTGTTPEHWYTPSDQNGYFKLETNGNGYYVSEEDSKFIKRQRIKSNLIIKIKSRANPIQNIPENEQVAIETLREEITETEFRKYIKYGFVLVKGQSGKTYQIFRNRSHTKVWKSGRIIEEVCVRIRSNKIPPTDNVIAFKNMIQIDENEFRKIGNIYNYAA